MAQSKFQISLRENGEHSFVRGIQAFEEYSHTHDNFLLKDAIMFSHHGIELLMKEVLATRNEYLIFEELRDLPKKQLEADRLNIDIFSLEKPPKTVSYDIAIERVQAFIKPSGLDNNLRQRLDQLNRLRNQIEHYRIEIDKKEVEQILAAIYEPLLKLFEDQIGRLSLLNSPYMNRRWDRIQQSIKEENVRIREVYDLVKRFKGQKIPGYLLNIDDEVTLPIFDKVEVEHYLMVHEFRSIIDVWAEGKVAISEESKVKIRNVQWIIEVKAKSNSKDNIYISDLSKLASITNITEAVPWLIIFNNISERVRKEAKSRRIMLTGIDEWEELKNIIEAN